MNDLEFDNVSKRYRVQDESVAKTGMRARLRALRPTFNEFWAVRDVSFAVKHGEVLGIIGHNGAGKSTILKLISSITTPTFGEIRIFGRLAALIEVGSGFHPELTGRENVYLSGSILGMRRREITENFDRIVDFAGVRQFIDTPVKRYSSGMYVRLGFAIAAHLNPVVLLLDEVLAVGDASFQEKCLARIDELKRAGTTIVFISHDLGAVERICDRVLLMDRGTVSATGSPADVIAEYERVATTFIDAGIPAHQAAVLPRLARVSDLLILDSHGDETVALSTGDSFTIRLTYEAQEEIRDTAISLSIRAQNGDFMCEFSTSTDIPMLNLVAGEGVIEFRCSQLGLQPGKYYFDTKIRDNDWQVKCITLRVDPGVVLPGAFYMPHKVRHLPASDLAVERRAVAPRSAEAKRTLPSRVPVPAPATSKPSE